MELKQQKTEDHLGIMFYFFVVPVAITACALAGLWQLIIK